MIKPIFLVGLVLLSMASFGQFSLSGKVVDSESHEPLQGASVFAQNTTRGTITDKDGLFHLYLDKGGYELIVSYTGYTSKTITVQGGENREINVELQKADNSMSEVIIRSSNEVPDGWLKYGHFFVEHFIGNTPFADSCTLQNPEVLKFLYFKRNDRLKVLASEPLVIANNALGYNMRYELDSFLYFFKTDINSYRGRCLYTEMEGTPEQQKLWKENRQQAYYGSRLHFLRAYYDSTLSKEGFTVDINSKTAWDKFDRLVNPYDTAYYFFDDSTENAELWFPVKASISYTRKAPEKRYLQEYHLPDNVPIQISYINLLDGIIIKPNGYFFDQQSWINEGYWSWKNLADQLPYDYEPEK
jgi:hypothetical protein